MTGLTASGAADLLAIPIIALGFRALGPSTGALAGTLGGMLLLPRGAWMLGVFPVDRRVAVGLGLLLGIAGLGRRAWAGFRPSWLDVPILALVLAPLLGLAFGVPGAGPDVRNMIVQRALGDLAPYLAARLFLGDEDGPRRALVAIAWAGLLTLPICFYEEVAGPPLYLSNLVFGTVPDATMVRRLGGYRPEGFLDNGLMMASWMALAAVSATWLWLGGGWRYRRIPIGVVASALVLGLISCRGVYGYITLVLGVGLALLTRGTRSRAWIAWLAAVPLLYVAARGSGSWDGRVLDRAAIAMGRPGTVGFRLDAEDGLIARVLADRPAFGFGNYVWHAAERIVWPDGIWLQVLWSGGLVGVAAWALGLYAFPAGVGLVRPRGRPTAIEASSPRWALACWSVLSLVEMLHNNNTLIASGLIAGTLVAGGRGRSPQPPPSRPRSGNRSPTPTTTPRAGGGWAVLLAVVAILAAVEVVGRIAESGRGSTRFDPAARPQAPPPPTPGTP